MSEVRLPQRLDPVRGPMRRDKVAGVRAGMGDAAPVTSRLIDRGLMSPDLMCGLTLFLLTGQPRTERMDREGRASASDGGVWVREQFTCHRPVRLDESFSVEGTSTGRYVRKGRRYATTVSSTRDAAGRLLATNLTTGLLAYRVEEGIDDEVVGIPYEETPAPAPDHDRAPDNPHRDALGSARPGDVLGGDPVLVSLAMMAARDTENPDNPIHSDPERARQAGLQRPIAGGSHVLAFALEPIMARYGDEVLLHGACVDARWRAPTHCDTVIVPTAEVVEVAADHVRFELGVALDDAHVLAMVGSVTVPR